MIYERISGRISKKDTFPGTNKEESIDSSSNNNATLWYCLFKLRIGICDSSGYYKGPTTRLLIKPQTNNITCNSK